MSPFSRGIKPTYPSMLINKVSGVNFCAHHPYNCLLNVQNWNRSFLIETISTFLFQASQKPFSKTSVQCLKSKIATISQNGLFCFSLQRECFFPTQEIYLEIFIHHWCIEKEIQSDTLCLDLKCPVVKKDCLGRNC